LGLAEIVEARIDGRRVISSTAYPLTGVTILTSTLVKRILISNFPDGTKVATGVELSSGQKCTARREVILSAGSIKTPQLLMLSGIGPVEELQRQGIQQLVDSPEVGKNLWDHLGFTQQWKLDSPELGAAFGSPACNDPKFMNGNAMDWHTTSSAPTSQLKAALVKDLENESDSSGVENHELMRGGERCHIGLLVFYVAVPLDGSLITAYSLNYLPTSRGTVTLASPDIETKPFIDYNHYATYADRYRIWTAVRIFSKLMFTTPLAKVISGEAIPPGCKGTSEDSTDEEIDERVKKGAITIQHHAGTTSMRKVVDSELKVKGVKGLRVVDASIIPTPISCPIQTVVYALEEQAVDLILGEDSV
jgi:choline dehydrogenase-like flavoprotein